MAISSPATNLLGALLPEWHLLLQQWSLDGRLSAAAQEALLLDGEPALLKELTDQWAAGYFSGLPPIVLLPASSMPGAAGAYAISTGTIYINQDWLETASKERVLAVLTEELGHYLDGLLNRTDTPGDEGYAFSKALQASSIGDLNDIGLLSDQSKINANDQTLVVELSSVFNTAIQSSGSIVVDKDSGYAQLAFTESGLLRLSRYSVDGGLLWQKLISYQPGGYGNELTISKDGRVGIYIDQGFPFGGVSIDGIPVSNSAGSGKIIASFSSVGA